MTDESILEKPDEQGNPHDVILKSDDTVYVLDRNTDVADESWYKILYDGMMVYVSNDGSFEGITLDPLEAPTGSNIMVKTDEENLEVRAMPFEDADVLGTFANGATIILTNETPQEESWYAVYGQLTDGSYSYGWCFGERNATSIYDKTLNVRSSPDPENGTILGSIAYGEKVVVISKNAVITNGHTWHKILFNNSEAYVIVGKNSPNFEFENAIELKNRGTTSDDTDVSELTPISGNYALSQSQMENNAKIIYNYLRNEVATPWSKNAICAVLGNMQAESTINPGRWQSGVGPGYGLVQWEFQQEKLFEYLELNGYEDDDLYGQLEYLINQCENGNLYWNKGTNYPSNLTFMSFNDFRTSTTSVETLTRVFLWGFEKAGTTHEEKRINNANEWYSFFS